MEKPDINTAPTTIDDGGWGEWDEIWNESVGTDNEQLYVDGPAKTPRQFIMQAYFDDLWQLMGERAATGRYLELGSGRGTISMYLASKGCDVTLCDLSDQGLNLACKHFVANGLDEPKVIRADARGTELPDGGYDCVFNIGLLEHFEDPMPVLRESCRLLEEGGLLYSVIVPDLPLSRRWPMQFLLNPIVTGYRMTRTTIANLVKGRRADSSMVRTEFSREDWVEMMASIDNFDADCIPYNGYHQAYQTAALENRITLPLIRAHHGMRRRRNKYPLLQTSPRVARADLLYARKTSR